MNLRLPTFFLVALSAMAMALTAAWAGPHVLLDARSGDVYSHQQAFTRWPPASLTKMMTAYVVFDAIKSGEITIKSPVRVSKYALTKPPSKMGLPVGTILNFGNALKIILVKSANDIAVSIAESVSGSEEAFAIRMNETAARLGMVDTNFVNPHGLHDPRQFSTARDLAILARAFYRDFPQYTYIVKIPALQFGKRRLKSYNTLLGRYDGADGIKTGYVCASGFNIAATAIRNGKRLIAIVLGEKSAHRRGIKTAKLLNAGFDGTLSNPLSNIETLEPYGDNRYVPRDISSIVCDRSKPKIKETKKQRNARWKADALKRKAENALYFSPRQPFNPVQVVLGNATGPSPVGIKVVDGRKPPPFIPVPTRRPEIKLARIDEDAPLPAKNRRGSIPLPKYRPQVTP